MEPPAHFPLLCKKALRVALSLHKKQPQADLSRCRHTLHISLMICSHKMLIRIKRFLTVFVSLS